MSSKSVHLNIYNKYAGCEKCPFRKENGDPCDHPMSDIIVKFHADNFQNGTGRRLWRRGNKVQALGVVIGGICFCAKAYSTTVYPKVYEYIWLEHKRMDIYLIVGSDPKKPKKSKRQALFERELRKWQRSQYRNQ